MWRKVEMVRENCKFWQIMSHQKAFYGYKKWICGLGNIVMLVVWSSCCHVVCKKGDVGLGKKPREFWFLGLSFLRDYSHVPDALSVDNINVTSCHMILVCLCGYKSVCVAFNSSWILSFFSPPPSWLIEATIKPHHLLIPPGSRCYISNNPTLLWSIPLFITITAQTTLHFSHILILLLFPAFLRISPPTNYT